MISVIKWAWQAKPDTPAEKLVLVSLANSTFQTPREDIAVVGVRALRGTACDMTPAELDAILDRLEKQGFITPLAADSEPVKWHIGALERGRPLEGMASQRQDGGKGDGEMSVRAVSWAYGLNLGSMTQKAVLLYLAYRAREEDDCAWPSVNLIQVETELSERAVRKALRELRDKGLIALGDQELAAVDFHGDVVPVNRRPKVWTLRLDASTESFNGVERAEDVQTAYTGRSVRS